MQNPKCQILTVSAGQTFLMPSGWIHAVYTPEDSIAFGGNFLNSFCIETQLKMREIDIALKVEKSSQFPLFDHLMW